MLTDTAVGSHFGTDHLSPVVSRAASRRVEVHPDRYAIVEFDPDRTFECVDGCSWCCHHGVLLYDRDLIELAARESLAESTTRVRGEPFVRKTDPDRETHVGADGRACAFLDAEGRCHLQATHDWKPSRCAIFPLEVWREDGALHVAVRDAAEVHCEGMDVSERRLIDHLDAFMPPLLWDLENPDTRREL